MVVEWLPHMPHNGSMSGLIPVKDLCCTSFLSLYSLPVSYWLLCHVLSNKGKNCPQTNLIKKEKRNHAKPLGIKRLCSHFRQKLPATICTISVTQFSRAQASTRVTRDVKYTIQYMIVYENHMSEYQGHRNA